MCTIFIDDKPIMQIINVWAGAARSSDRQSKSYLYDDMQWDGRNIWHLSSKGAKNLR